ncbi:hybrid sensor histidine kinase/response regulator [Roseomonas marmotae]|uniref:histidine kinase n=1 Tax=Roseomonas marmotae TaxID=2768161 RepID=A0ABS3K9D1_9PROT|nr:ATP-binding protein [Roseomonas marmotae]MBO1074063.1 response regulator [Roseomonas marmotae]QTI78848.1 response regulator [Roseomonas marmotae]
MQLHIPTLLIAITLMTSVLGLMWLVLAWKGSRVHGVGYWGTATLLFSGGSVLGALRGAIPDFLSIDIANALILLACGFCFCAARRFDDRSPLLGVGVLGAVAWISVRSIPGLTDLLEVRIIFANSMAGAYIIAAGCTFALRWRDMQTFRSIVSVCFILHGLIVLSRVVFVLLQPEWSVTTALPDGWYAIPLLEAMVHTVVTSFSLLAMIRERELRHAVAEIAASRDAADRANAAKSLFLARMSHELRTPLNGVLGLAQVLSADRSLPAEARSHGTMIERAGRHLLGLVNDVLDLSQVESGHVSFDIQPVPLGRLMDSAVVLVRPAAGAKQIHLQAIMAPGCPQVVMGDQLRLRQVLLNLLGNAVKYTPEKGAVRLELRPLEGQGIRIEVTDTGPGIPPEQRDLLFRDFSQLPSGTVPAQEGHGLGLAISARLVEAMEGRIGMAPGPGGRGSCFWADLPLPAAITLASSGPARRTNRILVVDDVALNRLVVQALLESAEYEVVMAESGREAIAALAESQFDLVLMDVQMPEMSGLEATRHIRAAEAAQPGAHRTPIVALTGEEMADEIQACFAAGMDGHLTKPADRAGLLALVHRVTQQANDTGKPPLSGAA